MSYLQTTTIACFVLGSSALFASTMGAACSPDNSTVPCEKNVWEFGGHALYLQSIHTGPFAYLGTIGNNLNNIDAGWDWGFALDAIYHYGAGNSVGVNWNRVDFNADHFVSVADVRHYETNWDAVNVALGQTVDNSVVSTLHFSEGVQYVRINSSINRGKLLTGFISDYNGFGPRVSMDMNYNLGNGFGVYGKTAGAVLIGTSSFSDLVTVDAVPGSLSIVVPEFEAKVGADYTCEVTQGNLTIDAGYMWFDYLNVHHNTATSTGTVQEGSFAAAGPYFGLNYVGNV